MALKDWTQSMWDKIKASNPFGQADVESNMANGGFSGYKPNTAKHRAMRETMQQTAVGDMSQMDPMMTGMNWEQPQQMEQPNAFGGFTGMVPPQATGYQATGYQPTGYQQPMNSYTNMQQPVMGYQPTIRQQPVNAWQEQPQQTYMDPMAGYGAPQQNFNFGNTVQFPGAHQGGQFAPQQNQPPVSQPDNISYMPGNFVGEDGTAYSHCERIAMIANVSMCYRIIEFMRNNESVIISTEQITDEAENQRCLDLLYGAAFSMKCSFTRISAKSIYLVAPGSVMVIPYKSVRQMSDQDISARWPEQERTDRRDRYASRSENRYGARSQGYTYGRRDYAQQDDYAPYGGYNAVGYGR
ncbi:MAG: cell division protein SepF [Clostridia bacterium]|nr:cell division protein SepF [Clostridia bacterium]